jgi:hypothetical protein
MKLQLDTDKRTIKVEEDVVLQKLIMGLEKLFPDDEWKTYTLLTGSTITWTTYPTYIYKWDQPSWDPWYVTSGTNTVNFDDKVLTVTDNAILDDTSHIYNISIE